MGPIATLLETGRFHSSILRPLKGLASSEYVDILPFPLGRFFFPPLPPFSWFLYNCSMHLYGIDLSGGLVLTPSFHLVGEFFTHLPQWGPLPFGHIYISHLPRWGPFPFALVRVIFIFLWPQRGPRVA